jgi:catalase
MSIEKFTFPYYIRLNKTEQIQKFINVFSDEIENIPENAVSSRVIMKCLKLDNTYKTNVFKTTYMEFFKEKILRN